MNRNQKIIVSITGITIVLIALLGITYAYYLTRIEGNTNTNSISITTADLKLSYSDGNGIVEKNNFMPGEFVNKTFSVENTGENKVQGYTIVLEDVINELTRNVDLKYSLYCKLDNGNSCGKSENNLYPKTKNIAIIYANDIESGVKHNYELIVNYIYLDDVDQSDDMGSTISGKINIYDAKDERLNPFSTGVSANDNQSLAYNIIENARLGKNGTTLTGTPLTKPAEEINLEEEKVLATTQDDYGTSYFFRGAVEDNYVNFAGMCWRIVRIQGDGSVKLILEDKNFECDSEQYTGNWGLGLNNFGYYETTSSNPQYVIDYLEPSTDASNSLIKNFYDFQVNKLSDYLEYLKNGDWCLNNDKYKSISEINGFHKYEKAYISYNDENEFYYGSFIRLIGNNIDGYNPTLKCNGELLTEFVDVDFDGNKIISAGPMYVGTITADEAVFSGVKWQVDNHNLYLLNEKTGATKTTFWTISPYIFSSSNDTGFLVGTNGNLSYSYTKWGFETRVSIILRRNITISSGTGIKNYPYSIG